MEIIGAILLILGLYWIFLGIFWAGSHLVLGVVKLGYFIAGKPFPESEARQEQEPETVARSFLHEHGDLGWHSHEYYGNHAHFGNHMSGPFYYTDERVIDQRNKEN